MEFVLRAFTVKLHISRDCISFTFVAHIGGQTAKEIIDFEILVFLDAYIKNMYRD